MVSLRPSDASSSTGFPRGKLEITGAHFGTKEFNANYGSGVSVVAFIDLTSLEETDDNGQAVVHEQWYSVGDAAKWAVTADGNKIQGEGSISKGCNFYKLVNALVGCGYPEDRITDNVTDFLGIVAQWDLVTPPNSAGRGQVLPTVLYEYRGSASAAATTPAVPATPAAPVNGSDLTAKGIELVKSMLAAGSPVQRRALQAAAFSSEGLSDDEHLEYMQLLMGSEFTAALEGAGIKLDGETYVHA